MISAIVTKLLMLSLILGVADVQIPESAYRVRPTAWFFQLKSPGEFKVARPGSFADLSQFLRNDMRFTVGERVSTVWTGYRTINPLKIWSSNRAWLYAVYSPSLERTLYRKDLETTWPGFEKGMKVYIDMSSLPVAVTHRPAMMVGLEITRMDASRHIVEYRYLEGSPSYGKQVLSFRQSPNDPSSTEVLHETWYRSYGKVVEAMYPVYHRDMLKGMHGRFKQEIEGDSAP
jgi:hypothetical protein